MNKKRLVVLIIVLVLLLGLLMAGLTLRQRLNAVEAALGPASETLSPLNRIRTALRCYAELERFKEPLNPTAGLFLLEISEQEGVYSVLNKIGDGLDTDTGLLLDYWVYTGADRQIRPGRYAVDGTFNVEAVTDLVTGAGKALVRFSFLSGMRLEEIAELIDSCGFSFSGADFLQAARNYDPAKHPAGISSLEGYFVPGSYEMSRGISLDLFLDNFVDVFRRRVQAPYESAFSANGLSLHEAVTMASMIAREAMSPSEYGLIASVFYNRIAAGMKFESDPTAQYAIGWDGKSWWKNPLTAADVGIFSPYNTYVAEGFPPGPICSADTAIYEAVAYPERTDYYYFRARCDNTPYHNFSRTYEEHVSYGCN